MATDNRADIYVYDIGTRVRLADDVPATIIDISISGRYRIQYRVAWWSGRERKSEWVEECEIRTGMAKVRVGFLQSP